MLKLQTPVDVGRSRIGISYSDRIMVLGSCFADNVGKKMAECGFNVCVNPFGTLYNPVSVCSAVARLESGGPFTGEECVQMGSGSSLICSFSHHTSFARETAEEFLRHANGRLAEASEFYRSCGKVIVTLGTSWCYRHTGRDMIVSNCLKRDAKEFTRQRLDLQSEVDILAGMVRKASSGGTSRQFIFTVSPIRHLKDGAHGNLISKATLLLAEEEICGMFPGQCEYFPAYEIMMDELRDYRFYADDLLHPSPLAVQYLWEWFSAACFSAETRRLTGELDALQRDLAHRPFRPGSEAHQRFLEQLALKIEQLKQKYPYLDLEKETSSCHTQLNP